MKTTIYAWPKEKNACKNPYNKILYTSLSQDFNVVEYGKKTFAPQAGDILHIHWPDRFFRSANKLSIGLKLWGFTRLAKKIKRHKAKIVWTVHNIEPHKYHYQSTVAKGVKKIASLVDGLIFLSESNRLAFFDKYPELETQVATAVIPHIDYRGYYPQAQPLDIDPSLSDRIKILYFGVIRSHKGLEGMCQAAQAIGSKDKLAWLLAGDPGEQGLSQELANLINKLPIAYKNFNHVNDQELANIFSAADIVLLPYEKIFNSGTAILAVSMGKRLIAPAMGSLVDLQKSVGDHWIYLYQPPLTPEKLERALVWHRQNPSDGAPDLSELSPQAVSAKTGRFYRALFE